MRKRLAVMLLASAASASAAGLSNTDRVFLANAVRGNNYEIEAAKLALLRAHNTADYRYARMMINDHRNLAKKVKMVVQRADPSTRLPVTVTYKQEDMLNALRHAGHNFDALYRQQMIDSHNQTYQLFDKYSRSAYSNAALRGVVQDAKPTVRMHWNHALNLPRS